MVAALTVPAVIVKVISERVATRVSWDEGEMISLILSYICMIWERDVTEISETEWIWEWVEMKMRWANFHLLREVRHENLFSQFNFQFWRDVSHENILFTSSTFTYSRMSGTKTSFSHFKFQFLSVLNAKSCFWFAAQCVRDGLIYPVIMFPSFSRGPRIWTDGWGVVLTTASFRGKSRTQASFSQLRLSGFQQSLARKLRCHNFNLQFFGEVYEKLIKGSILWKFARAQPLHKPHFHEWWGEGTYPSILFSWGVCNVFRIASGWLHHSCFALLLRASFFGLLRLAACKW